MVKMMERAHRVQLAIAGIWRGSRVVIDYSLGNCELHRAHRLWKFQKRFHVRIAGNRMC
jgi:IS1 family transposase